MGFSNKGTSKVPLTGSSLHPECLVQSRTQPRLGNEQLTPTPCTPPPTPRQGALAELSTHLPSDTQALWRVDDQKASGKSKATTQERPGPCCRDGSAGLLGPRPVIHVSLARGGSAGRV